MYAALLVTSVVALAAGFAIAHAAHRFRGRRAEPPVLTDVVINTKRPDDQTFRGLVDLALHGNFVHLTDAREVVAGEERPAGEISVPRDHVAWIQHL